MKTVKVHDETHRALKRLKSVRRSRSIDQVIREMISDSTGTPVGKEPPEGSEKITGYIDQ